MSDEIRDKAAEDIRTAIYDKWKYKNLPTWRETAFGAMEEYANWKLWQAKEQSLPLSGLGFAKFLEECTRVIYEDKITLYRYEDGEGVGNYILDDIYQVYLEKYADEQPQSLHLRWVDDSISNTQLNIGRLEVNCFDEDSEMSIRVGKSGYQSLSMDEAKELVNFIISHIKNESESTN